MKKCKCRTCGGLYDDMTFKALYKGYCSNHCMNTMVSRIRRECPDYRGVDLGEILVDTGEIGHVPAPENVV